MTIELNSQEQTLLVRILERELTELPSEVRRTETSSYRDELKKQEHVLQELCRRLKGD